MEFKPPANSVAATSSGEMICEPLPYRLLMVEDNEADAKLIRWAIRESKVNVTVDFVTNGMEAVEYLEASLGDSQIVRPDAMLVDLSLPKLDGWELLGVLKTSPRFKNIPVIIFSTSHREDDRERCLSRSAFGFYTKPCDLDEFEALVSYLVREEFPKAMALAVE